MTSNSDAPVKSRPAQSSAAMVIAFNPELRFIALVQSLVQQFKVTIIVDNGNCRRTAALLKSVEVSSNEVVHICNHANLGLGAALNRGLDYANRHRIEWLLTFDHDSHVDIDFTATLFDEAFADLTSSSNVALVGPTWRRAGGRSSIAHLPHDASQRYVSVMAIITSGSCVHVDTAVRLGGFNEEYFIDSVDHEFCLRAKQAGYQVIVDTALTMNHVLGNEVSIKRLGREWLVTHHSAQRRYYITRNKIMFWCAFLSVYPRWVLVDIRVYLVELLGVFLFERGRLKKLIAIVLGPLHAVLGVRGRLGRASRLLT